MLQTQTVAEDTLALIKRLMADNRLNDFILVGGTALALTLGHRESIDIDLFSNRDFDSKSLAKWLKNRFNAADIQTVKNGVFCFIDGVKLDLLTHAYPEVEPHLFTDGIRMMSLTDIAAMKLHAIVQSGKRLKDFTDVYFLLEKMPLSAMYIAYERKYFPDASAAIARLALNDSSGVDLAGKIQLLDRPFDWKAIKKRLQTAIETPQKMFQKTNRQHSLLENKASPSFQKPDTKLGADNINETTANSIILATTRPIQDKALLTFLQERKIPLDIARKFCIEADFLSGGKRQKAVGFENRSGGFELLSSSFSGNSYPVDVTIMNNKSDHLSVFENFLDFLSYAAILQKRDATLPSSLVLNTLSLFEKCRPFMEQHRHVSMFLPRGEAGRDVTEKALSWNKELNLEKYRDGSKLYAMKRSLNEWLRDQRAQVQKQSRKLGRGR